MQVAKDASNAVDGAGVKELLTIQVACKMHILLPAATHMSSQFRHRRGSSDLLRRLFFLQLKREPSQQEINAVVDTSGAISTTILWRPSLSAATILQLLRGAKAYP